MGNIVLWALSTGFITGGVWVGIVLLRHQRRRQIGEPVEQAQQRVEELDRVDRRLAEVEERLDATEQMIVRQRDAQRLDRPGK